MRRVTGAIFVKQAMLKSISLSVLFFLAIGLMFAAYASVPV